jgi:hypothetical protein
MDNHNQNPEKKARGQIDRQLVVAGRVVQSNKAITSVPVPALRCVNIKPPLPNAKTLLIQKQCKG